MTVVRLWISRRVNFEFTYAVKDKHVLIPRRVPSWNLGESIRTTGNKAYIYTSCPPPFRHQNCGRIYRDPKNVRLIADSSSRTFRPRETVVQTTPARTAGFSFSTPVFTHDVRPVAVNTNYPSKIHGAGLVSILVSSRNITLVISTCARIIFNGGVQSFEP